MCNCILDIDVKKVLKFYKDSTRSTTLNTKTLLIPATIVAHVGALHCCLKCKAASKLIHVVFKPRHTDHYYPKCL